MRYDYEPFDRGPAFLRWRIEDDKVHLEYSGRSDIERFAEKYVFSRKFSTDVHPVRFVDDGTVIFTLSDGSQRTLIPWNGEYAEALKDAL